MDGGIVKNCSIGQGTTVTWHWPATTPRPLRWRPTPQFRVDRELWRWCDRRVSMGITLVEMAGGKAFPAAPVSSIVLSSVPLGWRGIVVEWHRLDPQELPEHYIQGHGIAVNLGNSMSLDV